MKKISLALGIVVFITTVIYLSMYLQRDFNFCVTKFRVVNDEEKIANAIQHLLDDYPDFAYPETIREDGALIENRGTPYQPGVENIIRYKDVSDFLEKNPNCCTVYRTWNKKIGEGFDYIDYVGIKYKFYYIENNQSKSSTALFNPYTDTCGNIWVQGR